MIAAPIKKIDQLTVTRFFAAMSVLLFHSGGVFPFSLYPLSKLFASGQIPVSYFFVLSGFVLTYAYFRPEKKFDAPSFYFSRFSRIYPAYFMSFVLICLFYFDLMARIETKKILANVFLLQAWIPSYAFSFNYVSWSLSVEVFLYFVFPGLIWILARASLKQVLIGACIFWTLSLAIHAALLAFVLPQEVYAQNPLGFLNGFALGAAGGVWFLKIDKDRVNQRLNFACLVCGLVILVAVLMQEAPFAPSALSTALLAPVFVLIIFSLALDATLVSRILRHKWLVLLGDASYTLFILNIPIRFFLERAVQNTGLRISNSVFYYLFIPFIFAVSILVHRLFEMPLRNWLNRNKSILWLISFDSLAAGLAIFLAYFLRLGLRDLYLYNWSIFNFTLRVALPVNLILFSLFGLYQTRQVAIPWIRAAGRLVLPVLAALAALSAGLYWADRSGIISAFPRSVMLLSVLPLIALLWLSRWIYSTRISPGRPVVAEHA